MGAAKTIANDGGGAYNTTGGGAGIKGKCWACGDVEARRRSEDVIEQSVRLFGGSRRRRMGATGNATSKLDSDAAVILLE